MVLREIRNKLAVEQRFDAGAAVIDLNAALCRKRSGGFILVVGGRGAVVASPDVGLLGVRPARDAVHRKSGNDLLGAIGTCRCKIQ